MVAPVGQESAPSYLGEVEVVTAGSPLTPANPLPANSTIGDGVTPATKATVAQFHNADNQVIGTGNGLLTGGVAQLLNAAGNLDRQRGAGSDQTPMRGVSTGAATFAQEILATSTTTVAAAAATATLSVASTTGFQVGGTVNFEPSFTNVFGAKYESATITALVANTSITVAFPTGGALFTHTQPYTIQSFLGNQERDFSGEGPAAQGIGAAIATEFESNSGGPPLTTGLASGWTLDADRNVQGKNNVSMAITTTVAGDASLVFAGNPWISGLIVGQQILLSVGANGAAVEEVIVSKNNVPAVGAGPTTVKLVNPVVTSSSTFALFDAFGLNMPLTQTVIGVEDACIFLYNPNAIDPKRPLSPMMGNYDTAALITLAGQAAGTVNSADQTNYNGRGAQIIFDMTVATTTSVVISIQGKDPVSGKYYNILSSAAITTVSTNQLTVYPGAPVTANLSTSQPLPRTWRVQAVVTGGASAATATVGASVIV